MTGPSQSSPEMRVDSQLSVIFRCRFRAFLGGAFGFERHPPFGGFVTLYGAMRLSSSQFAVAVLAIASCFAAHPTHAVLIDSVDGTANVGAPSSPAGTTHGFVSGYVNVQARRSTDQVAVWQGTLPLFGSFLDFDPLGTPTQFGTATVVTKPTPGVSSTDSTVNWS